MLDWFLIVTVEYIKLVFQMINLTASGNRSRIIILLWSANLTQLVHTFGTFLPRRPCQPPSLVTTSRGKTLTIKLPPFALPEGDYYVALYFQDNRNPSLYSWRVFSVTMNGKDFYNDINVTTNGMTVYTGQWLLSEQTDIVLTSKNHSPVGPVINAGEILQIFPLGRRTH